ncbi:MAG: alpha/beta fold hydrolase [bacterium]
MMTLAYVFAVVVLTVALVGGHQLFWRWYYTRPWCPDERHFVQTSDGWRIALARLRPTASGPARGEPVVCFPGLACNGRIFDFDAEHSLGRHLADLGFDVWIVDPRGTGASERAGFFGRGFGYGFRAYADHDAPAAVQHVLGVTGHTQVLWVGHSMGGLVGYELSLHHRLGDHLAGVVALGSPADFSPHRELLGPLHTFVLDRFLRGWPVVRLGRLCNLLAPLAGWVRTWPETLFVFAPNTPPRMLRHFMVEVVEDVPRQLLDEFADNVVRAIGFDGRPARDGQAALAASAVPVLAIAGSHDRVAPPPSVVAAVHLVGCEDATECVVGHDEGMGFGHLDLVVGAAAPRVIYPRVAEWLLARRSTRSRSSAEAPAARADASAASTPG